MNIMIKTDNLYLIAVCNAKIEAFTENYSKVYVDYDNTKYTLAYKDENTYNFTDIFNKKRYYSLDELDNNTLTERTCEAAVNYTAMNMSKTYLTDDEALDLLDEINSIFENVDSKALTKSLGDIYE